MSDSSLRVQAFRQRNPGYNSYLASALNEYGSQCCRCQETVGVRVGPLTIEARHQWLATFRMRGRSRGGLYESFWRWLRDQGYPQGFGSLCPTCLEKAVRGDVLIGRW